MAGIDIKAAMVDSEVPTDLLVRTLKLPGFMAALVTHGHPGAGMKVDDK